ncbi:MAG: branched-chain amino acid ABC transporter permease [Deltaproteobacteria bacterium]|nr:branched-chain amino acid ABC transporter permease [Deltaproteobacteria bacterium]
MTQRDPTRSLATRVGELRPSPLASIARSAYPFIIALGIAFVLQSVIAPELSTFKAKILLDIGIAIVLASSLNIVNGFAGQFSLGHAGFMMVGGYTAAVVTYYGSIRLLDVPLGVEVNVIGGFMGSGDLLFLAACVVGGLTAALAGLVVGLPSLRLRGDYLAIVTLGFGEILRVLLQQTPEVIEPAKAVDASLVEMMTHLGGSLGFTGLPTYVSPTPWMENAAGEQTGHAGIFFTYAIVGILLVAVYRLKASNKGRELLAVRENEIAAESVGVNTARVKVTAFVFAAFFAGVGGALFAHEQGATLNAAALGFQKSIDLVIMVVLGGMGSITGVVVAAAFLTVLPELLRSAAPHVTELLQNVFGYEGTINPDAYRMPLYALALIIVMIMRPQGMFGIKELWDLGPWRRHVHPVWKKFASGWLIPRATAELPSAVVVPVKPAAQDPNPEDKSGDKPDDTKKEVS